MSDVVVGGCPRLCRRCVDGSVGVSLQAIGVAPYLDFNPPTRLIYFFIAVVVAVVENARACVFVCSTFISTTTTTLLYI
jgi:hypothetical protein